MKKRQKNILGLTLFQWFEILSVTLFTIYFAIIDKESSPLYLFLSSTAAICGIFCVVLCAAGKKSQYYWGFANIIAYVAVSLSSKFYGEVMLNALYYLPSQFIGLYLWKKNYNDCENTVKGKKMKPLALVVMLVLTAAGIFAYKLLLKKLGGNSAGLDSASTVISITANALMVLRYREQWTLWIIVDAVTVVMWAANGDPIMTTMWAVYLINAFYGFISWTKMSREAEKKDGYKVLNPVQNC